MKHPLIIGAGGVTSYLLPVLLKTFRPEKLTLVDKDELEKRNLDRQMFDETHIGKNKAWALWQSTVFPSYWKDDEDPTIIQDWFTIATNIPDDIDCIFCCADNHMARHAAILKANQLKVWCFIGGNEYVDSQALVHHHSFTGTNKDLLKRYPDIATNEEGSPFRCTGEVQEASPQLAMANMHCAAKLLHLAWVYERFLPSQELSPSQRALLIQNLPVEFYSSLYSNDSVNAHT